MSKLSEKLADMASGSLHRAIADEALPNVKSVRCRKCGAEQPVDAADCLAHGWPKCCGATMTIDTKEK